MDSPTPFIKAEKVKKSFLQPGKEKLIVLNNLDLIINKGELAVITGVSGSGKSTLLHLLGGLDKADGGKIYYKKKNIFDFSKKEISVYRNSQIGFVFQFHYLMPELTVLENIAFPYLMNNFDKEFAFNRGQELLTEVGIKHKVNNMPHELSGGERQRVAIARGLINFPQLLLADEPTGNIDYKTGEKVFQLFRSLIKARGLTCLIVTHNESFADQADSSYKLVDGHLVRRA